MRSTGRRAATGSRAARDDAVRVLRSNLLVALEDLPQPVVVVTSAQAGEGKTSTTVALARSLALAGTKVVVADLDLRHPDVHRLLDTPPGPGAADVLRGDRTLRDCLLQVPPPAASSTAVPLLVLPAGGPVTDPSELLSGPATRALLGELATHADLVLLDTPPVLPVADTLVVSRLAAGVVLVVEARGTPLPALQRTTAALAGNRTRLLGVVLNQLRAADDDAAYRFGYGEGVA